MDEVVALQLVSTTSSGVEVLSFSALGISGYRNGATSLSGVWQCIGMIVGVYGVGYLIAASDDSSLAHCVCWLSWKNTWSDRVR